MKLSRNLRALAVTALTSLTLLSMFATAASADNMYRNSDFIETEQPELNDETKALISLYQKNATEENYLNLRAEVIQNYNAVLDRKEAKLSELKAETDGKPGGEELVAEMEEIVQDMYITYWDRINSSMLRFTDTRLLKWKIAEAAAYEYIPVMGAGESISIKRTPVTNADYAAYLSATGAKAPSNWAEGVYPAGEESYPVNAVSYADAQAYCAWLTAQDGVNTYRLPSESEWELAAGHMPKDADFNCGVSEGRTPVDRYAAVTRGAHGAIDFWGNVWEWTSTVREETNGVTTLGVKGGAWDTDRTDCRTEYRKEGRNAADGYEDVGFRVIQVAGGKEPAQKVELTTLAAPVVSAGFSSADSITLSRQPAEPVTQANALELCSYDGMAYWLYTPQNATSDMSLVVFLHGKFTGSNPDTLIATEGFPKWLKEGALGVVPAYVLISLLPAGQKDWVAAKATVVALTERIAEEKQIDQGNISLTGFSMGGTGLWNLAASNPQLFSRVAPVSGGIKVTDKTVKSLSSLSIWAFVGSEDRMVNPQTSKDCIAALSAYQADAQLTEFEGAEHAEVSSKVYLESGLMNWLVGA